MVFPNQLLDVVMRNEKRWRDGDCEKETRQTATRLDAEGASRLFLLLGLLGLDSSAELLLPVLPLLACEEKEKP